jgi:hypothetical protein
MKKSLLFLVVIFTSLIADAATRYSYNNGGSVGWSSTYPTITAASAPVESDIIIITNEIPVTITADWPNFSGSMTVQSGGVFTLSGDVNVKNGGSWTVNSGGTSTVTNLTVSGGSPGGQLSVNGDMNVVNDFTNNNNSDGVVINGGLDVGGDLWNGNNSDITGTGGISVGGTIDNDQGGTIGGSSGNDLGTLPVELTYFEVSKSANGLDLNWQTASEINNHYFEVQRSENGTDFYVIGTVDGNETTNDVHNYKFSDTPIASTTYYRLRQVDFDGAFEYSKIKVGFSDKLASALTMTAYPNPAAERLSFKSQRPVSFTKLQLMNLSGQLVANLTDSVEGSGLKLDVKLPNLDKGLYYVQYQTATGEKGTHKLIIK